ncbi:MarR family transcriptional regulator [Streptomyces sp. URMC 127]|uniref:MarR family transcriptional regulator n=1 Tax=Streptomyces sp. URMC 127 TaxID=3423402 RepID=UPI003F1A2CF4
MTTTPTANARTLAHYAARSVLEQLLAWHGMTYAQQITLRTADTADTAGTPHTPDDLVTEVQRSLKTDPADIRATLDELLGKQLLVTDGTHLRPTDAGRELTAAIDTETAPVTARIWDGIPTEDLAATGRVLALVTERANTELTTATTPQTH